MASHTEKQYMTNKVKLHLELVIESPTTEDVVNTIHQMSISYVLPSDTSVKSTNLTHIELLSRGGIS